MSLYEFVSLQLSLLVNILVASSLAFSIYVFVQSKKEEEEE